MSTLLDTNILTRLAQADHPRHVPARGAVKLLLERGEELFVVPQNLYEFWAVTTRPGVENGLGMSIAQAQDELARIKRLFAVLRDERGILPQWERLVAVHEAKGKTANDARFVAAMERHGLTHLLTFNADHFARFPSITVLTPENVLQTAG